jgi:hypothetical protein
VSDQNRLPCVRNRKLSALLSSTMSALMLRTTARMLQSSVASADALEP